ncbi:uncharacterized protein BDR25DRAFT_239443, partial [Lindgomyces ingoldianus]
AQVEGMYGNNLSHDLVPLKHSMPFSPILDTPGLLAWDPIRWVAAARATRDASINFTTTYLKSITTLNQPTSPDTVADALISLSKGAAFLSINATPFNLASTLVTENHP